MHKKKECDEFVKKEGEYNNKYEYSGYDVELIVETSEQEVRVPYIFVNIDEYYSDVRVDNAPYYYACNYNETTKKCDGSDETVAGWTEYARIYGKYTMKDAYVEKYTGAIKNTVSDEACNAGDKYFVNFNEFTRPETGNERDKGYSLKLIANRVGNNLTSRGTSWNLSVDCWYQVKNLIFPQTNSGGKTDELYEEIGGTGFMYRIIDLNNPFPNRQPGANWEGKESIIMSTKDNLSTLQRFVINLNSSSIGRIREYNDVHSYESFNIEIKEVDGVKKEYSSFVESFNDIIDRK